MKPNAKQMFKSNQFPLPLTKLVCKINKTIELKSIEINGKRIPIDNFSSIGKQVSNNFLYKIAHDENYKKHLL